MVNWAFRLGESRILDLGLDPNTLSSPRFWFPTSCSLPKRVFSIYLDLLCFTGKYLISFYHWAKQLLGLSRQTSQTPPSFQSTVNSKVMAPGDSKSLVAQTILTSAIPVPWCEEFEKMINGKQFVHSQTSSTCPLF